MNEWFKRKMIKAWMSKSNAAFIMSLAKSNFCQKKNGNEEYYIVSFYIYVLILGLLHNVWQNQNQSESFIVKKGNARIWLVFVRYTLYKTLCFLIYQSYKQRLTKYLTSYDQTVIESLLSTYKTEKKRTANRTNGFDHPKENKKKQNNLNSMSYWPNLSFFFVMI